jgi:uncharacterized phage-like protein YoqJ
MKHPTITKIKDRLLEVIESVIVNENVHIFISGGALGFDQIAFWCVCILKEKYALKNILAIPFKNQNVVWSDNQKYWYNRIVNEADQVTFVDELEKYKVGGINPGIYHVAKMQKRNQFMVDNSNIVIAYWDGSKGGTKNCLDYALSKNKIIYQINPNLELNIKRGFG